MAGNGGKQDSEKTSRFLDSLVSFTQEHKARHWEGSLAEFLQDVLPTDPVGITRTSHQYMWDMIQWYGSETSDEGDHVTRYNLFANDLFGVDEALERVANYFKAASEGSEVGRRLLLLLGPPSGGKSSLVILLKRGLEEYSHTDDGAQYAIKGCPV
ncbi:MAG TPA: serine protein kinase, partial [Gammaproteobacteria bacterium]|nr:serine protein kinase [Gammaproteobacteria bacterium]